MDAIKEARMNTIFDSDGLLLLRPHKLFAVLSLILPSGEGLRP